MRHEQGTHVDPGLEAMTSLALGDYERARERIQAAIASSGSGMDPLPLLLIRQNTWADPSLDTPQWIEPRSQLAHRIPK
jgi:hypothetical protein